MNKEQTNYLKSIQLLPAQIKQAYQEAQKVKIPQNYQSIDKVAVCGMGGSQLGVDFVKHLFSQELKVPIIQVRGYDLPKFVDDKTLVILISYSGNTEEVLSINSKFQPPRNKQITISKIRNPKPKFIIISSGGKLEAIAKQYKIPAYIFNPINNPSGQPRLGTGYIIGSLISILKRLKLAEIKDEQITILFKQETRNKKQETNKLQSPKPNFQTPDLIRKLKNKIPVIVASEFLQGNAHIMANQINESAKQLALYFAIPELNHHLLEGLTFPQYNQRNLYFLFFYSRYYHPRNQKRYKITQEVLRKQKINYQQIEFSGDKINQAIQMLMFGSHLSDEVSKVNRVNPNETPWVNYFKRRLS
jgi:glucose/mannose-6-phosphate isomerase